MTDASYRYCTARDAYGESDNCVAISTGTSRAEPWNVDVVFRAATRSNGRVTVLDTVMAAMAAATATRAARYTDASLSEISAFVSLSFVQNQSFWVNVRTRHYRKPHNPSPNHEIAVLPRGSGPDGGFIP